MVDGAILVVDASEGVMSQTKFVVSKALKRGLKLVVCLNKADRDAARLGGEVETEVFDLFCNNDASDEQLDFPVLFASAKQGWAVTDMAHDKETAGMEALLKAVVEHIPPPCDAAKVAEPFAFSVNNMSLDPYLGRLVTGKVHAGTVETGAKVTVLKAPTAADAIAGEGGGGEGGGGKSGSGGGSGGGSTGQVFTVTQVFCVRNGTERVAVPRAQAGDVVVLAGVPSEAVSVADTVRDGCGERIVSPV